MRRVVYAVASSLDGYIAGPNGEYDWIVSDPEIDFAAIFARFDVFLMGRRTYGTMPAGGVAGGVQTLVFSRTLRQEDHPGVRIVADDAAAELADLRSRPGKDIWLFGGGVLFRSLLELGQVDAVEVAVIPVLLGGGVPLLPTPATRAALALTAHRVYGTSGIVSLEYAVKKEADPKPARSTRGSRRRPTG